MKRYLAFFGLHYYPCGGMDDFIGDFETIEECKNAIDRKIREGFSSDLESIEEYIQYQWEYSWANIYDTKTRKEVYSK